MGSQGTDGMASCGAPWHAVGETWVSGVHPSSHHGSLGQERKQKAQIGTEEGEACSQSPSSLLPWSVCPSGDKE